MGDKDRDNGGAEPKESEREDLQRSAPIDHLVPDDPRPPRPWSEEQIPDSSPPIDHLFPEEPASDGDEATSKDE
ncbi:MAG TPA: hypothetical protein VMN38_09030 [Sphingomicrobium sp.]|nr:hypothetical protein [Sphingomicrobium sp.]